VVTSDGARHVAHPQTRDVDDDVGATELVRHQPALLTAHGHRERPQRSQLIGTFHRTLTAEADRERAGRSGFTIVIVVDSACVPARAERREVDLHLGPLTSRVVVLVSSGTDRADRLEPDADDVTERDDPRSGG
jgi:hypothetical protein